MDNSPKSKRILLIITVCLTNMAVMSDFIIIPAANNIYQAYHNEMVVNFILSGACLTQIAAGILCGSLLKRFGKRKTILTAFILFGASGILLNFFSQMYTVAILRAVSGFTVGIINAVAMSLIADNCESEENLGTMMGIYNCSMAGMGVILSFCAGQLATQQWTNIFKLYWVSIPIIAMIALFIPETQKQETAGGEITENGPAPSQYGNPIIFVTAYFFFNLIYGVMNYQVAVYIAEKGLGGSDVAGVVTSLQTVGSMIACVSFGWVFGKLKRKYSIIPWIVFATGYMVLFFSENLVISAVAATIMGAFFGGGQTFYITWVPIISNSENKERYVGYLVVAAGLGLFFSTYLVSIQQHILKTNLLNPILPVLAAASGIFAVLSVLSVRTDEQKIKSMNQEE